MKITDIEPTKGHVLVELPPSTSQVGDIIVAGDQANTAPVKGTILRISEAGSPFRVGEVVFFRKYAIDELKFTEGDLSQVEVFIVDEREILGVVREVKTKEVVDIAELRASTKESDQLIRDKS